MPTAQNMSLCSRILSWRIYFFTITFYFLLQFSPHPSFKEIATGKLFIFLHCAFDQTKLNFALFREGRPLPYGYVALSIVGEAFCLPIVSNLINTIFERTMYAKTLPAVKFFGVTMSNIYAIGCRTSKFDITISEFGSRHCRPFFQKSDLKSSTQTN